MSEDTDPAFTEAEEVSQEVAEVAEESLLEEEDNQDTFEESLNSEPAVEVSQEEIEEFPNSEEVVEKENPEQEGTVEENSSEVLEPEMTQVEETVQEKYDRSLKKTRTGFGARLNAFFANFRSVDEEFFEELEELLIMSDVGVQVASNLTEELRYEAKLENAKKPDALRRVIIEKLVELYEKDGNYDEQIHFQDGLTVMLFVGVNGVGKTTSIGKLAHRYKQAGKKVMLVAADTFRAGAVAQLAEWGSSC